MSALLLTQSTPSLPINGTNEVQLLTIGGTPTAGTINFSWGGRLGTTAATWSATNATLFANLQAVLDQLLGAGNTLVANLSCSSGIGTINITFQGTYSTNPAKFLLVATNGLTGTVPTAVITRIRLLTNFKNTHAEGFKTGAATAGDCAGIRADSDSTSSCSVSDY